MTRSVTLKTDRHHRSGPPREPSRGTPGEEGGGRKGLDPTMEKEKHGDEVRENKGRDARMARTQKKKARTQEGLFAPDRQSGR